MGIFYNYPLWLSTWPPNTWGRVRLIILSVLLRDQFRCAFFVSKWTLIGFWPVQGYGYPTYLPLCTQFSKARSLGNPGYTLGISQLRDNGLEVNFNQISCIVKNSSSSKKFGKRQNNLYIMYIDVLSFESCFLTIEKDKWLWHRMFGHVSMKNNSTLSKLDLVKRLPKINFDKYSIYEVCIKGKQVKSSIHSKKKCCFHLQTSKTSPH